MKFQKAKIEGVWTLEPEKIKDERGFFVRTWCRKEFEARGLNPEISQCSMARNDKKSTLRGMHFQMEPYAETKTVCCVRGAIYDVLLDLRPGSKTFCQWMATELSEDNLRILYVPAGLAHGYQTLTERSDVFYQMSVPYKADAASGVRWNDVAFNITWPTTSERIVAVKDQNWPDFVRPDNPLGSRECTHTHVQ